MKPRTTVSFRIISILLITTILSAFIIELENKDTFETLYISYLKNTYEPESKTSGKQETSHESPNEKSKYAGKLERKSEGEEEEGPKRDRPDEAYELELKKTRIPGTNIVPVERLIEAREYAELLERTTDDPIPGITWKERGPNNVGGRSRAILVDLNDVTRKTIFAGGVAGGLWKTTDITQLSPNWVKMDDFFSNLAVSCITQSTTNPQIIYFGTGEGWYNIDAVRGLGIWKSTNGGNNWFQLPATNNSDFHYVQKIIIHPPTQHVYASTRNNGVMRSTDGGNTWQNVLGAGNGAAFSRAADLELSANNAIYASVGIFQTDGIYKSHTGNPGSWVKLNTPISGFPLTGFNRLELATAPNDSNVLYVLAQNLATYGVLGLYKTTNGGTLFTAISNPVDADPLIGPDFTRMQAWYDLILAVDPNNSNTVYTGGIDLFKSSTGGSSWQQISHWYGGFTFQDVHADQHAIVFQPGSSSVIYFGNDGGIYRTSDGTAAIPTIKSKETGYNTTQFYACAIHPTAGMTHFLAGAQDNGSHKLTSAGIGSSVEVTGGDGAFVHIDQNQPQYQFTSYVYNNYFRSTDGGNVFTAVDFGDDGQFINPTDYDDTNNIMYCGKTDGTFMRWNDPQTGNSSATVTVTAFGTDAVTAVTVSPNTRHRVFFGLDSGKVVRIDSANTGTSKPGVNISAGLPVGGYVSCIEVQKGNDNHLLVAYSNYGINSIWETTNGGTSWTSIEGNMPDMPVRWITFSPVNTDHALAATELGIWTTDNLNGGGTVWGPSNSGFANVSTHMIQYRTSDNLMIAATHGRGVFSTEAFTTARADFGADRKVSFLGKSVQFTDNSYQATTWLWNFGDGGTSTSANPTHAYSNPGVYNVSLTINGSVTETKNAYITVLPNKGTPYTLANGGNFEVNAADFAAENLSGSKFERGKSNITGKDSTHSGNFAWVTGINDTVYKDNTHAILYSPNYNFTASGTYTIRFWGKFSTEFTWDGFRVEASTNRGDSWTYVGGISADWYNWPNVVQNTVFPVNEPYFSGAQPTFKNFFTNVSSLAGNGNVAFRFVFKSDGNTPDIGLVADDFEIQGPPNVITETGTEIMEIPEVYDLLQNYPNPFNPVTKIKFQLPEESHVKLKVFDVTGREVAVLVNDTRTAGYYAIDFNGNALASGVYFYRLETTAYTQVKKMLLIK